MNKKVTGIPTMLAFEKKLVLSDGMMYASEWGKEGITPLKLREKSVRGTISNRLKNTVANDPLKLNAEVEKPNLQTIDACYLNADKDTLVVSFTLKVLSGIENPAVCNSRDFVKKYQEVVKGYVKKYGFKELGCRYAYNLANARFLWRNRLGASKVMVEVKMLGDEDERIWNFDAMDFSLVNFEENYAKVEELGGFIAEALAGKKPCVFFKVTARALIGEGQEVYPSEELVLDKGRGKKSKILYSVSDVAAMHSQKLGNAIRTIDTWYKDYGTDEGAGPIAAEVYGAVTNMSHAFRVPKQDDFYALFDKYALGEDLEREEDEHYVFSVLVRGGVFGSGKEE